jgi:hypothetical protein
VVRANGLEADREQVIDREHAGRRGPLLVAEGLDRADAPAGEILGHALNEHSPETTAGELAQHAGRHQQYRVRAHRARRKGDRSGHVLRRREKDVRGRDSIDVKDFSTAAPFEQNRGDPGLLFQCRVIGVGPGLAHRIQFPEDAGTATRRKVAEIIQRDIDKSA